MSKRFPFLTWVPLKVCWLPRTSSDGVTQVCWDWFGLPLTVYSVNRCEVSPQSVNHPPPGDTSLLNTIRVKDCFLLQISSWEKSSTSRLVSVVTRSVPSSGRSSLMSMESTPLEPTLAHPSCRWRGLRWVISASHHNDWKLVSKTTYSCFPLLIATVGKGCCLVEPIVIFMSFFPFLYLYDFESKSFFNRFTTTKPKDCHQKPRPRVRGWCLEASLFPELSWLTWSLAPWTVWDQGAWEGSSDLTTSCSDSLELATTGPRVTTLKVRIAKNICHAWLRKWFY